MTRRIASRSGALLAYLGRSGAIALLGIYHKIISPLIVFLIGPSCRFEPTCSEYAAQAIDGHGVVRGGWMAIKRFLRCRPGAAWGYDPGGRASHNQGCASQTRPPIGAAAEIKPRPSLRGAGKVMD